MTTTPPKDQQQRQQAINPSISVHLEAPAGSGKTSVLMTRYLALLARVQEPEEILALTFTRKAAGELRARIQKELDKRDEPPPGDLPSQEAELRELALAAGRRHAEKGISLLERLQVSTFHGFCAQLLRLLPHQAGLPPDFNLLEESETTRWQQEAVELMRRRLAALPGSDPARQALVRRLVRLNNNWPRLAAELQGLLARRDILRDFITLARESRDPAAYEAVLWDHLGRMILPGLARLSQEFRRADIGRQWPELYRCLADSGAGLAETLPGTLPGAELDDLAAWRNIADGILTSKGECYKKFTKPNFSKGFRESPCCQLLQDLQPGLVERLNLFRGMSSILIPEDEVAAVQDLIILLHQALNTFDELCGSRRSLDFTALEQKALRLLESNEQPEIFSRLDHRLTHLLVDEFQDTSLNQIRLLCRLLASWQGDPDRSLMVVGDPKQSIYGWRQARVELFFKSRLDKRLPCPEAPPFEVLTLETNFRSTSKLIEWINIVFGVTIMPDKDTCGVEFHAAVPKPPEPDTDPGKPPHLSLFTGPDKNQTRTLEADWLARELCQLQKKLSSKETVGVLLFTRRHLPTYLEACRRAGLSLKVKDGLPLGDSLAVRHLHNVATALIRPHDDLAWAALLRGFAGPQPLSLLAAIAAAPGDFWYEKIKQYAASPDGLPEVQRFYRSLELAGNRVGREPLHEILAAWLTEVKAWPKTAAWEQGPQGVANVKAYLDLVAAAAVATPEATLIQVADLLAEAYQPPDPRAQDSPVEILTVHAAKGLEFDYVYVPHLDWEPLRTAKHDAPFLMEEVSGSGNAVIALNRPYTQKVQSVLYRTLKTTANQRALGEARRLFYVAVTRAQKRLHLSGVVKPDKNGEWKFPSNSPMGWLRQHYADSTLDFGTVNLWKSPPLPVTISDEVSVLSAQPETLKPLPPQYAVQPEPWLYDIQFPSQLAVASEKESLINSVGTADPAARRRGEIIHRLLEDLARGVSLPEPTAVVTALHDVAASSAAALALAQDILAEIRACQADPFLSSLLDPNLPVAKSEWLLEAWHSTDTIYRGQIDRLVFDGDQWWLLDYKTSRPAAGVDWEDFIASEVEKYRPQLLAYREMVAKYFEVHPPEIIHTVLYFTAGQRHVII